MPRVFLIMSLLFFIFYSGVVISAINNFIQGIKGSIALLKGIKTAMKRFIILTMASALLLLPLGILSFILLLPHFHVHSLMMLMFIIVAFFLFLFVFYYDTAILIDNKGVIGSFKTSWHLVRREKFNWLKTFFILILFGLLAVALNYAFVYMFYMLSGNIIVTVIFTLIISIIGIWFISIFLVAYLQMSQGDKSSIQDDNEKRRIENKGIDTLIDTSSVKKFNH